LWFWFNGDVFLGGGTLGRVLEVLSTRGRNLSYLELLQVVLSHLPLSGETSFVFSFCVDFCTDLTLSAS
jgi:hypothetical protein